MTKETSTDFTQESIVESPELKPFKLSPAGKWRRLANALIDFIAMYVLQIAFSFLVALIFRDAGVRFIESLSPLLFYITFYFAYYVIFESATSTTVGKFMTGTIVVTENGSKPSINQIIGRTFTRLIPLDPISFMNPEGRGWHDSFSGTYVVKIR